MQALLIVGIYVALTAVLLAATFWGTYWLATRRLRREEKATFPPGCTHVRQEYQGSLLPCAVEGCDYKYRYAACLHVGDEYWGRVKNRWAVSNDWRSVERAP